MLKQDQFQTGEMVNSKPIYTKVGNPRIALGFADIKNYPTPWTMWGGLSYNKGSHMGNVKIGPRNVTCPEMSTVSLCKLDGGKHR